MAKFLRNQPLWLTGIEQFYRWRYRDLPEGERNEMAKEKADEWAFSVIVTAVFTLIVTIFALLYEAGSYLYDRYFESLQDLIGQSWINLIAVLAIFSGGILLYKIRENFRIFYSLIEIGFSVFYGWHAVDKATSQAAVMADTVAVVAMVYLMVRGADNFAVGMTARKERLAKGREIKLKEFKTPNGSVVKAG